VVTYLEQNMDLENERVTCVPGYSNLIPEILSKGRIKMSSRPHVGEHYRGVGPEVEGIWLVTVDAEGEGPYPVSRRQFQPVGDAVVWETDLPGHFLRLIHHRRIE